LNGNAKILRSGERALSYAGPVRIANGGSMHHAGPWRYLPKDFPPFTTVQNRFYAWRDSGLWEQIVSVLVMAVREAEGRDAAPNVIIVDSQSVKPRKRAARKAMTPARRSKAASAMSRSIHWVCRSNAK
jgi:transposase